MACDELEENNVAGGEDQAGRRGGGFYDPLYGASCQVAAGAGSGKKPRVRGIGVLVELQRLHGAMGEVAIRAAKAVG